MSKRKMNADPALFPDGNIGENPFIDYESQAVVEPYYSNIVRQVEKIERDLVILSQSALAYLQCCTDYNEAYNMTKVLRNLLDEHKLQMKIVDCASTTFCLKQ